MAVDAFLARYHTPDMPIYAVIATKGHKTIEAAIEAKFPGKFYALKDDTWFVASDGGTTAKIADELGIRDGRTGSGLVVPIRNYSGRAPADLWEWLETNWRDD